MQGIASLPADMAPADAPQGDNGMVGSLTTQEAATLGRLLSKVSTDEVDQLRELATDLRSFTEPELRDFLGGVDYIMQNAGNYKQSVRNLVARGVVEAGDLPADYVPTFYSILRQMIVDALKEVSSSEGFAKGGLATMAKKVAAAGRDGDTMLAHITPREAAILRNSGGAGTINPKTGIVEYKSFWSKVGNFLKKAAPVILPIALSFIPGIGTAVGAALGVSAAAGSAIVGAVGSGVGGLIAGQKPGQALLSAALGGVGGYVLGGGLTGGEGISGLFSGGATGAEAAANQATSTQFAAPGTVNPTVNVDASGAAAAPGTGTSTTVPLPPTRPIDLPTTTAPTATTVSGGLGSLGGMFDTAGNWVKANPLTALTVAGLGATMLSSAGQKQTQPKLNLAAGPTGQQLLEQQPGKYGFDISSFKGPTQGKMELVPTTSPAFPSGYSGELPGYYGVKYAEAGGHISGPGTGTSDSIPAKLSDGEFVLTAKAVRGAGDGDRIQGAKRLYKLMHSLERRA